MLNDIERTINSEEQFKTIAPPKSDQLLPDFFEPEFLNAESIEKSLLSFWSLSAFLQKKSSMKLDSLFKAIGVESLPEVCPKIYISKSDKLVSHWEACVELNLKIYPLLKMAKDYGNFDQNGLETIERSMIAFVLASVTSKSIELRLAGRKALTQSGPFMAFADSLLLPALISLLHGESTDDAKLAAAEVAPIIAQRFSKENAKVFLMPDLIDLTKDESENLRIAAVKGVFVLLEKFGTEKESESERMVALVENLIKERPALQKLIPQGLVILTKLIPVNRLDSKILPFYLKCMTSKGTMPEFPLNLGLVISNFLDQGVNIDDVTNLQKLQVAFFDIPNKFEIGAKWFAISVANVVRKFHSKDWAQAKKVIEKISKKSSFSSEDVKLKLLSAFITLATKITAEQVEKDLLILIRDNFLNDTSKIRIEAIFVLPSIIKELHPITREKYADLFIEMVARNEKNWRLRAETAVQIPVLYKLFSSTTRLTKITPLYFGLMKDECANVRNEAAKLFAGIYSDCYSNEESKASLRIFLIGFGCYPRFTLRISFVKMLKTVIIKALHLLDADMVTTLIDLATDKVLNVRIEVGNLINVIKKEKPFENPRRPDLLQKDPNHRDYWAQKGEWINQIIDKLCIDTDSDLFEVQKQILVNDPKKLEECNQLLVKKTEEKRKTILLENQLINNLRNKIELEKFASKAVDKDYNEDEIDQFNLSLPSFLPTSSNTDSKMSLNVYQQDLPSSFFPTKNKEVEKKEQESSEVVEIVNKKDQKKTETPLSSDIPKKDIYKIDSKNYIDSDRSQEQSNEEFIQISKKEPHNVFSIPTLPPPSKERTKDFGDKFVLMSKKKMFDKVELREEYKFDDETEKKSEAIRLSKPYNILELANKNVQIDDMTFEIKKNLELVSIRKIEGEGISNKNESESHGENEQKEDESTKNGLSDQINGEKKPEDLPNRK